jgi:hypothetical protein
MKKLTPPDIGAAMTHCPVHHAKDRQLKAHTPPQKEKNMMSTVPHSMGL